MEINKVIPRYSFQFVEKHFQVPFPALKKRLIEHLFNLIINEVHMVHELFT